MNIKNTYRFSICETYCAKREARRFIKKNHYSKTCPGSIIIFQVEEKINDCRRVGAAIFSWPSSRQQNDSSTLELRRLVCIDDTLKNLESWFIGKCLKYIKINISNIRRIISYADERYGHTGIIYRASNFVYLGTNKPGGGTYIINGVERHGRHIYDGIPKHERNINTLRQLYTSVVYIPRSKKHLYEYKFDK